MTLDGPIGAALPRFDDRCSMLTTITTQLRNLQSAILVNHKSLTIKNMAAPYSIPVHGRSVSGTGNSGEMFHFRYRCKERSEIRSLLRSCPLKPRIRIDVWAGKEVVLGYLPTCLRGHR